MEELIEKLKKEHDVLLEKMEKLDKFLDNEDAAVEKAGAVQVYLLHTQLTAMELYLHTLEARMEDLENQENLKVKAKTVKEKAKQEKTDKPKEKEEDKPVEDFVKDFMDALSEVFGKDFKVEVRHFSNL